MKKLSWHTEKRKVSDLIPWDRNPHTMNDRERKNLSDSIDKFDYVEVIVINTDNRIIGGHQRVKDFIAKGKQEEMIEVRVPSRKLSKKEFEELGIRLNKNRGHDDEELLKLYFEMDDLAKWGFDEEELNTIFKLDEPKSDIVAQSLQERFIIPPFSVFDSRQGYWQDRKKEWHSLGFNSQETREDVQLVAKSGQAPAVYELRNKMRVKLGRDPEWDEIIAEADKKGLHIYSGASIFDPVLAEISYRWFCVPGGSILDPFAGGSVRGIVAGVLGFDYLGIDLRPEQCETNEMQWYDISKKISSNSSVKWLIGDSSKLLIEMEDMYDFIFSCPPYHDLEKYSDDPADLSNMTYENFLDVYGFIIFKSLMRLKPNRFACFVVGDIRDEKGCYRNFVSDTISAFTQQPLCDGLPVHFYNDIVLINVAGSLPVRIGRQFEGYRKVGKMHQNVLVFYKGDPKKIKEEFPEIKVEKYLQELNYQPNIGLSIVDD